MKKLIIILLALSLLFSAAFAEDLSAMTDEELLALHRNVLDEMARRSLPAGLETDNRLAGVTQRMLSFFESWNKNDQDGMLALCASVWKETVEDPRAALFALLANRTPLDAVIESASEIAGEGPGGLAWYLVTVTSLVDRNVGTEPERLRFRFLAAQEEDGLWYIDPSGLGEWEKAEGDFPGEDAVLIVGGTDAADTVLYYQPDGGEYYHLDPECRRVHPKYLPLRHSFLYSELSSEPYRNLKPCEICGAPAVPEE